MQSPDLRTSRSAIEDEKKAQQKVTDAITPSSGGAIVPNIPTPAAEKQVPGTATGFQYKKDGTWIDVHWLPTGRPGRVPVMPKLAVTFCTSV